MNRAFLATPLLLLAACRHDNVPSNNTATEGPRLVQVTQLETSGGTATDTVGRGFYSYDAQGRLESMRFVYYGQGGTINNEEITKLFYGGTDTLAWKSTQETHYYGAGFNERTDISNFYVYQNGLRIYDSSIVRYSSAQPVTADTVVTRHSHDVGRLISSIGLRNYVPPPNTSSIFTSLHAFHFTEANGNMAQLQDSTWSYHTSTGETHFSGKSQATGSFTTIPNPLQIQNCFTPGTITGNFFTLSTLDEAMPANAPSSISSQWTTYRPDGSVENTGSGSETSRYLLRPDGWPSEQISDIVEDGNRYQRRLIFTYQ